MKKLRQKLPILMGLVLLSFGIEGCEALSFLPFVESGAETEDIAVAPATIPTGTTPGNPEGTNVPTGENAEEPGFEDPVVEGEEAELPTPDGLIPITNRDAAVKILQQNQGRPNPFATLPVSIPGAVLTTTISEKKSVPKLPILPFPPIPPLARQRPVPVAPQRPVPVAVKPKLPVPVAVKPKLPVLPAPPIPPLAPQRPAPQAPSNSPLAPQNPVPQAPSNSPPFEWTGENGEEPTPEFNPDELPDLPKPTIAEGFTVTGVVNLGGTIKAIVQDSEGKSQYVSPGEYLGNGQVLVKRIEMNRGPQPVVIFEELGIEVIRAVGDSPADNNA